MLVVWHSSLQMSGTKQASAFLPALCVQSTNVSKQVRRPLRSFPGDGTFLAVGIPSTNEPGMTHSDCFRPFLWFVLSVSDCTLVVMRSFTVCSFRCLVHVRFGFHVNTVRCCSHTSLDDNPFGFLAFSVLNILYQIELHRNHNPDVTLVRNCTWQWKSRTTPPMTSLCRTSIQFVLCYLQHCLPGTCGSHHLDKGAHQSPGSLEKQKAKKNISQHRQPRIGGTKQHKAKRRKRLD